MSEITDKPCDLSWEGCDSHSCDDWKDEVRTLQSRLAEAEKLIAPPTKLFGIPVENFNLVLAQIENLCANSGADILAAFQDERCKRYKAEQERDEAREGERIATMLAAKERLRADQAEQALEAARADGARLREKVKKMDCECGGEWDREGSQPQCYRCEALSSSNPSWLEGVKREAEQRGREKAFVSAAKMACYRCRSGESLELVEIQAGRLNYCHSVPYSGYSICVADEIWREAKINSSRANSKGEGGNG